MKKAIATLLLFSFILTAFISCDTKAPVDSDTESETRFPEVTYPHSNIELAEGGSVIGHSDTLEIPVLYLKYFFADSYQTFCSEYSHELSDYLDTSIPLHDQKPTAEGFTEYDTWYDYFLKIAKSSLEYYISLYEQAVKNGISLSQDETDSIYAELDSYKEDADGYGMTFEEYMDERFGLGDGATYELMAEFLKMCQLGNKYGKSNYNSTEFSDDEIEKVFQENKYDYLVADYKLLSIYPDCDISDSDEKTEQAKAEAQQLARDFIEHVKSGDSFIEAYKKIYPNKTSSQYAKFEADCLVTDESYYYYIDGVEKNTEEALWLYDESRSVGDIEMFTDSNGRIKVVQAEKLPYRKDFLIPNIRICYISLQDGVYDEKSGEELCKQLVEKVSGTDDKEHQMKALVEEYSYDTSTKGNGGLVENIVPTYSSLPVDVASWCYEDGRAVGDVTYMQYQYASITTGYFVVYLDSYGMPYWKYLTLTYMKSKRMNELIELWIDDLTMEYNESMLDYLFK